MREKDTRDHSGLIAHQTVVTHTGEAVDPPKPARCTARTYGGQFVTVDGIVTHRMGKWLAFAADYPGWGQWTAIVERGTCEAIR